MKAEELKQKLRRELDGLERARDELRVQLHLAASDARDEFDGLERKWARVEDELNRLGHRAQAPIEEIGEAARVLIDEIKQGYARMKGDG